MIIYAFFGQRRRQAVVSRPMHSRFNIFRVNSPPYLYLTRNECTAQWTFVCMCLAKLLNHIHTADRSGDIGFSVITPSSSDLSLVILLINLTSPNCKCDLILLRYTDSLALVDDGTVTAQQH